MERPGLYIMVFIILVNSCDTNHEAAEAHRLVKDIAESCAPERQK